MNNYLRNVLENVKALKTIRANQQHDVFSNLEITQVQLDAALEIINEQAHVIASWINRKEKSHQELGILIHQSTELLTLDVYSILGKK